jgi:hypothetical protein
MKKKNESYRKQYKHHTNRSRKVMGNSTSCYSTLSRKTFTMYRYACPVMLQNNDATELCTTKGQLLVGNLMLGLMEN